MEFISPITGMYSKCLLKARGRHKMSHRFKAAFTSATPAGSKCCQRVIKRHLICQMVVSVALIHGYMMMSLRRSALKRSLIYCWARAETPSICVTSYSEILHLVWCRAWAHRQLQRGTLRLDCQVCSLWLHMWLLMKAALPWGGVFVHEYFSLFHMATLLQCLTTTINKIMILVILCSQSITCWGIYKDPHSPSPVQVMIGYYYVFLKWFQFCQFNKFKAFMFLRSIFVAAFTINHNELNESDVTAGRI